MRGVHEPEGGAVTGFGPQAQTLQAKNWIQAKTQHKTPRSHQHT